MRESFTLSSGAAPQLRLRTIDVSDGDLLRDWKNANRRSFFFQGLIDPEGQRRWYEGYVTRPHDFMFMVEADGRPVGCMGFRILGEATDIYNVIRGIPAAGTRGLMAHAFRLLCSYALATFPSEVSAKVLKDNPAVAWYRKIGFDVAEETATYYLVRLCRARFEPLPFVRTDVPPSRDR